MESALFVANGGSGTGCQMPEGRFVVDTSCQLVKLLDQENCKRSGDAKETDSAGDCASTTHVVVNMHKATPKVFRFGITASQGFDKGNFSTR
jgi:hypothetical protein